MIRDDLPDTWGYRGSFILGASSEMASSGGQVVPMAKLKSIFLKMIDEIEAASSENVPEGMDPSKVAVSLPHDFLGTEQITFYSQKSPVEMQETVEAAEAREQANRDIRRQQYLELRREFGGEA